MLRRAFVVFVTPLVLVGALSLPADASPLSCTSQAQLVTTLTICVDVSGSNRGVYIRATSLLSPLTLRVVDPTLYKYSVTNGYEVASQDNTSVQSGTGTVEYYGTPVAVSYGHVYYADGNDITVTYSPAGLTDTYGWCESAGYVN